LNWKIITILISLISIIPTLTGILKFKRINKVHKPFIYLISIYSITEILGSIFILTNQGVLNTIMMNFFVLLDFTFLYILLKRWTKEKINNYDYLIIIIGILIWLLDNFIINTIIKTNSLFRISYSLTICFFSINLLNNQMMRINSKFLNNPLFFASVSFIICYSYKAIYETIYFLNIDILKQISYYAFSFLLIINILTYILFTKSILCMEKKLILSSTY
jgi:hypothetical protein